ncbi:hypothetical protein B0H15DRAFT_1022608 [Mycena belliarum]|uniref:Uncharacterized protein n=1 Tax=Mycena belliarum TaxID=1033014 RepID=A0AAD6U2J0_9AGAR|nr:hypothetical protein B0H15DRAFT_1022608 [Mycena belliae]
MSAASYAQPLPPDGQPQIWDNPAAGLEHMRQTLAELSLILEGETPLPASPPTSATPETLRASAPPGLARESIFCGSEQPFTSADFLEPAGASLGLPLTLTVPRAQKPRKSSGCGTAIHIAALPSAHGGWWMGEPNGLRGSVIPLEAQYVAPDTAALMTPVTRDACGCATEYVGCAVCGNALGTMFNPCPAHNVPPVYAFLSSAVSPPLPPPRMRLPLPSPSNSAFFPPAPLPRSFLPIPGADTSESRAPPPRHPLPTFPDLRLNSLIHATPPPMPALSRELAAASTTLEDHRRRLQASLDALQTMEPRLPRHPSHLPPGQRPAPPDVGLLEDLIAVAHTLDENERRLRESFDTLRSMAPLFRDPAAPPSPLTPPHPPLRLTQELPSNEHLRRAQANLEAWRAMQPAGALPAAVPIQPSLSRTAPSEAHTRRVQRMMRRTATRGVAQAGLPEGATTRVLRVGASARVHTDEGTVVDGDGEGEGEAPRVFESYEGWLGDVQG